MGNRPPLADERSDGEIPTRPGMDLTALTSSPSETEIAAQFAQAMGGDEEPPPEPAAPPKEPQGEEPPPEAPPEDGDSEEPTVEDPTAEEQPSEEGEPGTIRTMSQLAEVFDVDPDDLLTELHITDDDGKEVPLQDVVSAWRAQPEAAAVASERYEMEQQFDTQRSKMRVEHDQRMIQAAELVSILNHQLIGSQPSETELMELRANDSEAAMARELEFMRKREDLEGTLFKIRAVHAQRQEEVTAERAALVKRELSKMPTIWPELANPKTFPETDRAMRSYLGGKGFKAEDINGIADSRFFGIIRDAMEGSHLRKSGKLAIAKAKEQGLRAPRPTPKALAEEPGQRQRKASDLKGRFDRLRQTGSVKDAAAVFQEMDL